MPGPTGSPALQYTVFRGENEMLGPFEKDQLMSMAARGDLKATDRILRDDWSSTVSAGDVKQFSKGAGPSGNVGSGLAAGPSADTFLAFRTDGTLGPCSKASLQAFARDGLLRADDVVVGAGWTEPKQAATVDFLKTELDKARTSPPRREPTRPSGPGWKKLAAAGAAGLAVGGLAGYAIGAATSGPDSQASELPPAAYGRTPAKSRKVFASWISVSKCERLRLSRPRSSRPFGASCPTRIYASPLSVGTRVHPKPHTTWPAHAISIEQTEGCVRFRRRSTISPNGIRPARLASGWPSARSSRCFTSSSDSRSV